LGAVCGASATDVHLKCYRRKKTSRARTSSPFVPFRLAPHVGVSHARLMRFALLCAALVSAATLVANPLQPIAERSVQGAIERFRDRSLQRDQVALTVVDLSDPTRAQQASVRGGELIYPASVIKLFYLAAAHRWLEDGKLTDTPELRRALRDMIVDSSNDATHYVIDLLTGTTSGPELPEAEIKLWFERRNAVTGYFSDLGYTGVIANKKPWSDGPYGRESQAIRLFTPKRNMLTTDATARLLVEIFSDRCVTPARSAEMRALLARDPAAKTDDPDDQALFIGPALPTGAKLWSKAGWTSQTRHDAAYIELPSGKKLVLVIFTEKHARERELLRTIARSVVASF
jgi:beta-lactamase class A